MALAEGRTLRKMTISGEMSIPSHGGHPPPGGSILGLLHSFVIQNPAPPTAPTNDNYAESIAPRRGAQWQLKLAANGGFAWVSSHEIPSDLGISRFTEHPIPSAGLQTEPHGRQDLSFS
jgi:hypothetical protein